VNALARRSECRAHAHEEAIEHVDALSSMLDQATVEATTKLHQILCCLACGPKLVQLICLDTKLCAGVHGVEHNSLGQSIVPLQFELLLELVFGYVELLGFQNCCL